MRTDGGATSIGQGPAFEDAANLGKERLEIRFLLRQQAAHMSARFSPSPAEADDMFDLAEGQSKPPALLDEAEQAQHVRAIQAIARWCTARPGQDTARLIQPECLAADTAALHDFPGSHGAHDKPGPYGPSQDRSSPA